MPMPSTVKALTMGLLRFPEAAITGACLVLSWSQGQKVDTESRHTFLGRPFWLVGGRFSPARSYLAQAA
jgi:hypothetical protein